MGCNVSSGGCNSVDAAMLLYAGSARTAAEQARQRKELDLLWKLTHGTIWDTQTDAQEAYHKTVPSGAVTAEIGSIGGKAVVQDGALLNAVVTSVVSKGTDVETLGTLEIPVSLRTFLADKGYGWSAGSVYNEMNLDTKKYIQRVGSVDLGALTWETENVYFSAHPNPACKRTATNYAVPNAVCVPYPTVANVATAFVDGTMTLRSGKDNTVSIYDSRYSSPIDFKSAMSGVTLLYELAEPVEYDISSYLTDDNMLDVEAGGTLTFVQEGGTELAVPSSVEYLVKLSEVETA